MSHFSTSSVTRLPLSLSSCFTVHGVCEYLEDGGQKAKGESVHGLPAVIFFFSPTAGQRQPGQEAQSCPSTICHAPGAARIYPHRGSEQRSLLIPPPSIQHPAPSRRRKQPVRGDLCFKKSRSGKLPINCMCTLHLHGYVHTQKRTYSTFVRIRKQIHSICPGNRYCFWRYCNI